MTLRNTTGIPHVLIREWQKRLNGTEFKIVITIADQTLGWVKNKRTKERKKRDRIPQTQLVAKTGCGKTAISEALKSLIDRYDLVHAYDASGRLLATAGARRAAGVTMSYGLNLHPFQQSLFGDEK